MPIINPNLPLRERFQKSYRVRESGCWEWIGGSWSHGYPYITHEKKRKRAHRVSYFLRPGHYPKQVNQTCDNTMCVNPDHLYRGGQLQNMRDKVERGRWRGPSCRFSSIEIQAMRDSGNGSTALAKEYGVSQSYMSRLLRGERGG